MLKEIRGILPELAAMHEMKESFRDIFESRTDWSEALVKLCTWMVESEQKFPKSCGTIKRWIGQIILYFDNRITQVVVEGINNKLKLIKEEGTGLGILIIFKLGACYHVISAIELAQQVW